MFPVVDQQDFVAVVAGDRLGLFHDQRTEKAIAVLDAGVGVVPMGAPRRRHKVVGERFTGWDGWPRHPLDAIHLPGARLVHAMPVHDRGHFEVVEHLDVEPFPLLHLDRGADQLTAIGVDQPLHTIGSRLDCIDAQHFARTLEVDHGPTGQAGYCKSSTTKSPGRRSAPGPCPAGRSVGAGSAETTVSSRGCGGKEDGEKPPWRSERGRLRQGPRPQRLSVARRGDLVSAAG